jgi:putative FmdB family regulatory protein
MPLYEYVCDNCDQKFEVLRPFSRMDDPADCPGGHKKSHRVLSKFAAVTANGGDYAYDAPPAESGMGGCGGGCDGCACGN